MKVALQKIYKIRDKVVDFGKLFHIICALIINEFRFLFVVDQVH